MTRTEALRQARQLEVLRSLGFTESEAESLRRISMTLRRWFERECGTDSGCIERGYRLARNMEKPRGPNNPAFTCDENGPPYWADHSGEHPRYYRIPDRETGAKKRLSAIIAARNARSYVNGEVTPKGGIGSYIQSDPRGAALYILRPGDVPAGQTADSCYSRGICVY